MEIKIIQEEKNKLVFDIEGETNTITGVLKKELWQDEHVKATGYHLEHPLINIPRFVIETSGAEPRKTISTAIKKIQKNIEKLSTQTKNLK